MAPAYPQRGEMPPVALGLRGWNLTWWGLSRMAKPWEAMQPGSGLRAGSGAPTTNSVLARWALPVSPLCSGVRSAGHSSPPLHTKAGICLSLQQANLSVFCQVGVGWKGAKKKGNSCPAPNGGILATPISEPYSRTLAAAPGR